MQRVTEQNLNSYTLKRLDRTPIAGSFSARCLREFIPREGTKLAKDQAALYQQSTENNQLDHTTTRDEDEDHLINEQAEEEAMRGDEDQEDEEKTGRTLGNEDAATGEGSARVA